MHWRVWQADDLSEDFEALEQQAAHETRARPSAATSQAPAVSRASAAAPIGVGTATATSRPSSRRNSASQWDEASGVRTRRDHAWRTTTSRGAQVSNQCT